MTIEELEKKLQKVEKSEIDDRFIAFCNEHIPSYPVSMDLGEAMNEYFDRCEDALMVFCGGYKEHLKELGTAAIQMKRQEIASGKWNGIYSEIGAAASLIAMRADHALSESNVEQTNTQSLMLSIGLFTYAVIACNDYFKPEDYRYIFCLAWWIYFGKILSVPVDKDDASKGLPS